MRTALLIIAEERGSERLKHLATTGKDGWCDSDDFDQSLTMSSLDGPPPPESSRIDWPRGLQQLGNTCYLNSLLQVRQVIVPIGHFDADVVESTSILSKISAMPSRAPS